MESTKQSQNEKCCENQCEACKCKVPMIFGAIVFSLVMLALGIFLGKTFFSFSPRRNTGISATPTNVVIPTTTEATSGANIANWKTYLNDKYGFEFKYPAGIDLTATSINEICLHYWGEKQRLNTELGDGFQSCFRAEMKGGKTLQLIVDERKKMYEDGLGQKINVKDVKLGEKNGFNITTSMGNEDYFDIDSFYYIVISKSIADPLNRNYKQQLDQILSTFKFTEKNISLVPADSQTPAAGVCAQIFDADIVNISINPDTPSPRCAKVTSTQKLKIANKTNKTIEFAIGNMKATIGVNQEYLFDKQFGDYLAPGVHSTIVSPYGGPEIWLQ